MKTVEDQMIHSVPGQQRTVQTTTGPSGIINQNLNARNTSFNNGGVASISDIVQSIQGDIKNLRTQMENIPPFPKGKAPPQPLAKFQNNLDKIENQMYENIGLNNSKVFPKIAQRGRSMAMLQQLEDEKATVTEELEIISKPLKTLMNEQKFSYLTRDPENLTGHGFLREKYALPQPNQFKYGRAQGGISNIELEKLGIGTRRPNKVFFAKRILPKNFRDDPFAEPPPITENDIQDGMFSLVNRGIIPRDVDLTPAFERGNAPFSYQQFNLTQKPAERPPQLRHKVIPNQIKYQRKNMVSQSQTAGHRDNTFLTAMNVENLDPVQPQSKKNIRNINTADSSSHPQYAQRRNIPQKDESKESFQQTAQQLAMYDPNYMMNNFVNSQNNQTVMMDQVTGVEKQPQQSAFDDQLTFIIKKGQLEDESQEFIQFKRANITKWGAISYLIACLEKFVGQYNLNLVQISAQKLIYYAEIDLEKYTMEEYMDCITNKKQVLDVVKGPQTMFKGPGGHNMAAIFIQKCWKGYRSCSNFRQLKFLMQKATIIQRRFQLYRLKSQTGQKLRDLRAEQLRVWGEMQEDFKKQWKTIKKGRRVEIHINSFSIRQNQRLTIEKYKQKENAQIARLFNVKDPNVDIIYVCPFPLTNEIYNYYLKILELVEIENPDRRFTIVVPENYVCFKPHLSLASALLYSPQALNQIKDIIAGKQAYIVPGKVDQSELQLSIHLSIPLYSGNPKQSKLFSTKSGAKRIFQLADVPVPIGAYDIYTEADFIQQLTKLIAHNLYINTWIFKIDDEFNGRGHASLNVEGVKTIMELRKKKVEMTQSIVQKLEEVMKKVLPKKIKIAQPSLFRNYEAYMQQFCKIGGVIEAAPLCPAKDVHSPSISFQIQPDGKLQIIGSFDKFEATDYVNAGCFFPQSSLPAMNLYTLCESISKVLYEQGIMGHVTVDLVAFPNPNDPKAHNLFWAVDINNELSENATICAFFDILMEGQLDQETGEYNIEVVRDPDEVKPDDEQMNQISNRVTSEPRNFMYCNFLHHPGLSTIQYKTFFHMCRLESISFDMEKRSGSTFCLFDSLQSGVIGMLTIGLHRKITVNYMIDALNFIQNQAGVIPQKVLLDKTEDSIQISDVISKVKLIHRAFEKKVHRQPTNVQDKQSSFMNQYL